MRKAGGASIINISSVAGITGGPRAAAYHASKGAVRIFTKAAAVQYATDNIRVNSVHPGPIATLMTEAGRADPERSKLWLSQTPLGRYGQPKEVAYGSNVPGFG